MTGILILAAAMVLGYFWGTAVLGVAAPLETVLSQMRVIPSRIIKYEACVAHVCSTRSFVDVILSLVVLFYRFSLVGPFEVQALERSICRRHTPHTRESAHIPLPVCSRVSEWVCVV
jgi:hypothetical protein